MNTRTKILAPADIAGTEMKPPVLLVTGTFDVLRADLLKELASARQRTGAETLVAVVRETPGELLPVAQRAQMAAALRMVDYVVIAGNEDLDRMAAHLHPVETIHLEEADRLRIRQLIEHVQRRQSC